MNSSRLFGRRSSACPSTKGSLGQVRSGQSPLGGKGLWNRHWLISKHGVVICAAQIRGGHWPLATDHRVRNEQRHWARFHRSDGHWHHHLADGPVGIDKIHFFIIYTIFNDQLSAGGKLRAHIIFFEGDLWKWRGTIVPESAHSLLSRGIHLLRRWATSAYQHAKERETKRK